MLKTDSKVYVVSEYGGQYEDKWEHIIGVCSSLKIAEKLKAERLDIRNRKWSISIEELDRMLNYLYKYEDDNNVDFDSEEEGLKKLFPDKNPKDIEDACHAYYSYDDFIGVSIDEVNYYN